MLLQSSQVWCSSAISIVCSKISMLHVSKIKLIGKYDKNLVFLEQCLGGNIVLLFLPLMIEQTEEKNTDILTWS